MNAGHAGYRRSGHRDAARAGGARLRPWYAFAMSLLQTGTWIDARWALTWDGGAEEFLSEPCRAQEEATS